MTIRSAADRAAEALELEASNRVAAELEAASPRGIRAAERAARQARRRALPLAPATAGEPTPPLQYRAIRRGGGHGYYVISFPASYGDVDVREVPDREKETVAGPYTSRDAAQTRASQENWRKVVALRDRLVSRDNAGHSRIVR